MTELTCSSCGDEFSSKYLPGGALCVGCSRVQDGLCRTCGVDLDHERESCGACDEETAADIRFHALHEERLI